MIFLYESLFVPIRDFFEAGGDVLFGILFVTILMWTLIIERIWFYYFVLPGKVKDIEGRWNDRPDTFSWFARQVRQQMVSEIGVECRQYLQIIKALMAILPLLGLPDDGGPCSRSLRPLFHSLAGTEVESGGR